MGESRAFEAARNARRGQSGERAWVFAPTPPAGPCRREGERWGGAGPRTLTPKGAKAGLPSG
eukprot:scaffold1554_cov401-Prasinococcus_capsulatus_cf.AAC.13